MLRSKEDNAGASFFSCTLMPRRPLSSRSHNGMPAAGWVIVCTVKELKVQRGAVQLAALSPFLCPT